MNSTALIQFFLPIIWAVSLAFAPKEKTKTIKMLALIGSLAIIGFTARLFAELPELNTLTQLFKVDFPLFFNISYTFSMDGLSGVLMLLNAFLLLVVVIATWDIETDKLRLYYFLIFALVWAVNGSLLSTSLYSFYIFWEAMLIPLFILVGVFGGENRKYASFKFFMMTAAGSILMLASMCYMSAIAYKMNGSYDLNTEIIRTLNLPFDGLMSAQSLVFWKLYRSVSRH